MPEQLGYLSPKLMLRWYSPINYELLLLYPSCVVTHMPARVTKVLRLVSDSDQYAHLLFNVLDKNQTGSISFDDFIYGLSTLIKGSTTDRLAWTFK